jgi:hypothetical protein
MLLLWLQGKLFYLTRSDVAQSIQPAIPQPVLQQQQALQQQEQQQALQQQQCQQGYHQMAQTSVNRFPATLATQMQPAFQMGAPSVSFELPSFTQQPKSYPATS